MVKTLFKHLVVLLGLMFTTATITFLMVELSPIDPVDAYLGTERMTISPEQRALIVEKWGYDQPVWARYARWMGNLMRLDFGISSTFEQPVTEVIWSRFKLSIVLMTLAWVSSGVIGYVLGVLAGVNQDGVFDRVITTVTYFISSIPPFYVGIVFLMLFAVTWKLFPVGYTFPIQYSDISEASLPERAHHLVLPVLTLSLVGIPNILGQTREKAIDVMESDYVALAKINGKPKRQIVFSHVLRNVSLPAITLLFANFVEIFGGSVLVEQVFSYPGLGRATVMAGLKADMALLTGIAIFSVAFVYIGNSLADILVAKIDPRLTGK